MSEQKKAYKEALKAQIELIKDIPDEEFPTDGVITFTFDLSSEQVASTRNDTGGNGGSFP